MDSHGFHLFTWSLRQVISRQNWIWSLVVLLGHDRLAKFANRIHDELAERATQILSVQNGLAYDSYRTKSEEKTRYCKTIQWTRYCKRVQLCSQDICAVLWTAATYPAIQSWHFDQKIFSSLIMNMQDKNIEYILIWCCPMGWLDPPPRGGGDGTKDTNE